MCVCLRVCVPACVRTCVRVFRMEMQEAKKIAEMKKREKMEERLARCYSELYNISRQCNGTIQDFLYLPTDRR